MKSNKNDVADAAAICEAVSRPHMRFVPVKSVEQQAMLAVHRARQGFVKARTAQANQIRGLLAEFGLVIPRGLWLIRQRVPAMLDAAGDAVPLAFRHLIERLLDHLKELDRQVGELEVRIKAWHRSSQMSRRLEQIPGIGPLGATALVASIADAKSFSNGRQLAAWLGLVPRQNSSGGKQKLLGMSKRGDVYLRTLLIHGARSAILAAQRKARTDDSWLGSLLRRRHVNIAAVALANKNARTIWALMAHDREFQADYQPRLAADIRAGALGTGELAINRSLSKPPLVELDAAVYRTPSCALALLAAAAFRIAWGKQFPTAVVCFDNDLDVCITHLKLPIEHRRVTRTSRVEG